MANYNAVDMDWLGGEIGECTDILRTKTGGSADIAFPEEFKSLLNGITPVIPGVSPTTITSNGTHSTGNYSQIKVEVPSSIPEGYIKPTGTKTITQLGSHDVTDFAEAFVDSSILNGYVAERYGLTQAERHTFNVSSESQGQNVANFVLVPKFVPKVISFNLTANLATNSTIASSSTHTRLVSSFWIDNTVLPMAGASNSLQKVGVYLYATNKVNVSRHNMGFEYNPNTNRIELVLSSSSSLAPVSAADGAYEIQYWG